MLQSDKTFLPSEWMPHIDELRRRLLICIGFLVALFFLLFYFNAELYHLIALPLIKNLPLGSKLIATQITAPFLVPLKLVFILSLFMGMPFFLYHIWAFLLPALYPTERRLMWPLLLSSSVLFFAGICFGYFVALPLLFRFLTAITPVDVVMMPDMSHYLDFIFQSFLIFGLAFEVPVVVFALVRSGLVSLQTLVASRPYVIVLAFILGMLLTPPDVVSQVLLAVPLWFLFEGGLLLARIAVRKKRFPLPGGEREL